jgi:murein L,D-transpeptidase YafK
VRRRRLVAAAIAGATAGAVLLAWPITGRTLLDRADGGTGRAPAAARRVRPGLERALAGMGLRFGAPVFLRVLKEEGVLELFVDDGVRFRLFRTHGICMYSGGLGPKRRQGDGQAPEGFYRVRRGQLNPYSNYHLSFDLGYPNAYERAQGWTGSLLMVHGSCVSIGCYAMTDAGIEEIYTLVDAALTGGQDAVPVHAFPFRLDAADAPARVAASEFRDFWSQLREGYLAFEREGRLPLPRVRDGRYAFDP